MILGFFQHLRSRNQMDMARNTRACSKTGCDSLVGTRYDVVYKWYYLWNEATVTVTGYPAKLTGVEFRKAKVD